MALMPLSIEAEQTLAATIAGWFQNFGGTSALDVARDLSIDHVAVMLIFEQLVTDGYGSMNKSVQLYQMSFDLDNTAAGFKHELVTTHIFFPSKEVLRKAFFASGLSQQRFPEYTTRLYLGAHQIGLVYFSEEVLSRYLVHPEHYKINDSLAGGDVSSLSAAPEDRYLYVRYGKCRLMSDQIVVTAIYKDLSDMSPSEQSYWHSHEIESPELDRTDQHFHNFLKRTYEGNFVNFHDPISTLLEAVTEVNNACGSAPLFVKISNIHLRLPVEQTYKSYCDSASELYKVLGPDNISQSLLSAVLISDFGLQDDDLKHAESGRLLSKLQLLAIVEQKLGSAGLYTKPLRKLAGLRVDADHKVLESDVGTKSYSREFAAMCDDLTRALHQLTNLIAKFKAARI